MNVKVGDWIRFYQGGKLVIGVVQYAETSNIESIEKLHDKQDASSNEQVMGKACDGQPEVNIQYVNKIS